MRLAADWRLAAVVGGTIGLAASPFWSPGGEWLRPLLVVGLVTFALVERGRAGPAALTMIAVAAVVAGLMVGGARLGAIEDGALKPRSGSVELRGFAAEQASGPRGTYRFGFVSERGRVLIETAHPVADAVRPGMGLIAHGVLEEAPDWQRADLRRRGIETVLRADRLVPNGNRRAGLAGAIDQLRERAFEALGRSVPAREAALSRGFVLGDDSEIDRRTAEDFRRSGLSHLLAVSGQNVVLLSLLALPFLSLLGFGPQARLLAIALLILLYVPLAGGGPSIQRAGVMGIAGLVAAAATRAPSRAYALALAALVTLTLNPRSSADIGWQLSFAAVVGIMLLARPFQVRLEPFLGREGWRKAAGEGAAVTLAATIATAPLIAFHFDQMPVATILANLAAMPAVAPAMWLGMISIAIGQASPALAVPFNLAGSVCLAWIAQVAEWTGRPGWAVAEVSIGGPVMLALAFALLGSVVFGLLRIWKTASGPVPVWRKLLPVALVLLIVLALVVFGPADGRRSLPSPPPHGARVEVLDIGQGDAILIRPWRADPVLIDGGPPGGDLTGALRSAGVDRLAAVILTHPDLDHYGGFLDLFGLIPVGRFLFDGAPPELVALAGRSGSSLERISAGQVLRNGNTRLEFLWPPAHDRPEGAVDMPAETGTNERSIVAVLEWRNFRMLLTGDAEAEAVPMQPGPIDVLKVSHHGSADSGLPALLRATSPRLAVIPVGEGNRHGHPVPEVLDELAAEGVRTFRTDRHGTVSIVLDESGWLVETGR